MPVPFFIVESRSRMATEASQNRRQPVRRACGAATQNKTGFSAPFAAAVSPARTLLQQKQVIHCSAIINRVKRAHALVLRAHKLPSHLAAQQ
jgi:hypothetical protein